MSPRALLVTGLGILVVGLLLVLSIDTDPETAGVRAVVARGYLSNACVLVGSALVVLSAVISAVRRQPEKPPPSIDHYS